MDGISDGVDNSKSRKWKSTISTRLNNPYAFAVSEKSLLMNKGHSSKRNSRIYFNIKDSTAVRDARCLFIE